MQIFVFELGGATYALKLEAVGRILAPGDAAAEGRPSVDLAGILGVRDDRPEHVVLLAGRPEALRIGRPIGTARIESSWIVPLPGYMFRVPDPPVRGIVEVPPEYAPRGAAESRVRHAMLLDEERLLRMSR